MFADGSQNVFSAVALVRGKEVTDQIDVSELTFVFGKLRVAPIKALTIPRLELQSTVPASRLIAEVHRVLTMQLDSTFMCIDNTTVFHCLHSNEKQPVPVAHRIAKVFTQQPVAEWNHVQSADNQPYAGSNGVVAIVLLETSWLKSPDFLEHHLAF